LNSFGRVSFFFQGENRKRKMVHSLSALRLIQCVKVRAALDTHSALDALLLQYMSKDISKQQLQMLLPELVTPVTIKLALIDIFPNIQTLHRAYKRKLEEGTTSSEHNRKKSRNVLGSLRTLEL